MAHLRNRCGCFSGPLWLNERTSVALWPEFTHFAFSNSTEYKDELTKVRTQQKECIKAGRAATGRDDWAVNGDKRKGAKMIHDMQKLLLRAFNCECDDVIDHVKFNNIEAAEKRIESSFTAISKLGTICGVAITGIYRDLKIKELRKLQVQVRHPAVEK